MIFVLWCDGINIAKNLLELIKLLSGLHEFRGYGKEKVQN